VSLSPRAIAVQGIGRSPRLVAVQGLWPDSAFAGGRRRVRLPRELIDAQAMRVIDEDDTMLLLTVSLAAGAGLLQ
jgi:hypothetical protein